MYGTWENAIYDYKLLPEIQKSEKRANELELPLINKKSLIDHDENEYRFCSFFRLLFIVAAFLSNAHVSVTLCPSLRIAGMRVEGEKLSPDGSKVAYLWNAEGKMPRDLYLVSTSGGEPQRLLGAAGSPGVRAASAG
jgi:hypothetical protein